MTKSTGRRSTDKPAQAKPEDDKTIDLNAYMFNGYSPEADKVSLYRSLPKEYQGVPTEGWIADLEPGVDESYIAENYGGGTYRMNRRSRADGKITATCGFKIPGFPRVVSAGNQGTDANPAAGPKDIPAISIPVGGVDLPFTGDMKQFADLAMMVKAIRAMFPDPPDINSTLLELALRRDERPSGNILDTVRTLKEAAELFAKDEPSIGTTVLDVVNNAVNKLPQALAALSTTKAGQPAGPGRSLLPDNRPGPVRGIGPGNPSAIASDEAGNVTDIRQRPEQTETEDVSEGIMDTRQTILAIATTIVQAWKLDPPKTVASTVNLIDLILNERDAGNRKQMVDFAGETIKDICETQMAEDWNDPESTIGDRKSFGKFLSDVYAEFQRPDRELMVL